MQKSIDLRIKIALGVLIIVLSLFVVIEMKSYNKSLNQENEDNRYSLLDQQLELKYWALKSELIDSVQSYIDEIAPNSNLSAIVLVNECSEANVSVVFALSQAQKESHFGTKGLGAKTNSVFNVGAYDNHGEDEINNRHKYRHPNSSVKPYLELLSNRYLVNKTEEDLLKSFVDINQNRYASYDKYETELQMIYDSICENTIIKKLEAEFIKLKVQRDY